MAPPQNPAQAPIKDTLEPERALELSELFKSLGDPTRVRILGALSLHERRVGELAKELEVSQSALSHQLRILRAQRIVTFRKEGKSAYYRLMNDSVMAVVRAGLAHCDR